MKHNKHNKMDFIHGSSIFKERSNNIKNKWTLYLLSNASNTNLAYRRHWFSWHVRIVVLIPKFIRRRKKITTNLSTVSSHVSLVTCHMSPVLCHLSPDHLSMHLHLIWKSQEVFCCSCKRSGEIWSQQIKKYICENKFFLCLAV